MFAVENESGHLQKKTFFSLEAIFFLILSSHALDGLMSLLRFYSSALL